MDMYDIIKHRIVLEQKADYVCMYVDGKFKGNYDTATEAVHDYMEESEHDLSIDILPE